MPPKPYYWNDRVTIYCADNVPLLEGMGEKEFDAVVTDPPYGIGEAAGKNKSRGLLATSKDYGNKDWDNVPCPPTTIELLRKVSQWQVIFGGNYFQFPPTQCWLVWDKLNGDTDFADCELAWTNLKKAVRKIEHLWHGMIRDGQEQRFHPTQKPVRVMKWSIEHLPSNVQTVLDPFAGVGTTGVACLQLGKRCVLIEREEKYCEIAARRIDKSSKFPNTETKWTKQLNTKLNALLKSRKGK